MTHKFKIINTCTKDNEETGCACGGCKAGWKAVQRRSHFKKAMALAQGKVEVEHGKLTTYVKYSCRCGDCTGAKIAYNRETRARKRAKPEDIPDKAHGTVGGYTNWSCRCDACREASRLYAAERRARA